MAISNANIKNAKTAAKEAGAVKETKAPAKPAPKANAPKVNAPKVNIQSQATKKSAESVSVAPVTENENVGKLAETLEVLGTLKTETKIDVATYREGGKYADGAKIEKNGKGTIKVSRPFTALIKVRNNHTEPIKYYSFDISESDVKSKDNTTSWGEDAMYSTDGKGRKVKEIASGEVAFLTYIEFCSLVIRPEYNNRALGGEHLKYSVTLSEQSSDKKEGFAVSDDKLRSSFIIRSVGKDSVGLHDAPGGVLIKATGTEDKKYQFNDKVKEEVPADVIEKLQVVLDIVNKPRTRGASGTRVAGKSTKATAKRDSKFDAILSSLNLTV